jgi:hypothetical protein
MSEPEEDKTIQEMNAEELFNEAVSAPPVCSSVSPPADLEDIERMQYFKELAQFPFLQKP